MGVHGLWQLLQPAGQQVTLESLKGKILAVDVSVWLHQSMKGMRDKYGNTVANAHLQFLFKRVSKLLFYGIKPVFVFDGGVPLLKLQTIAGRRHKREDAVANKDKMAKKLLRNVLKHHAVNTVLGNGTTQSKVSIPETQRERDMFELPVLPETDHPIENDLSEEDNWDERMLQRQEIFSQFQNLDDIDVESEDFKSLPPEIQHEILSDLRDSKRQNSWANIDKLPEDSLDFSQYQVQKLMKESKLSRKIENVRKELNTYNSGNVGDILSDPEFSTQLSSNKVVSDDTTHYILVKRLSPIKNSSDKTDTEKNELGSLKLEKDLGVENECKMYAKLMKEETETIEETGNDVCPGSTQLEKKMPSIERELTISNTTEGDQVHSNQIEPWISKEDYEVKSPEVIEIDDDVDEICDKDGEGTSPSDIIDVTTDDTEPAVNVGTSTGENCLKRKHDSVSIVSIPDCVEKKLKFNSDDTQFETNSDTPCVATVAPVLSDQRKEISSGPQHEGSPSSSEDDDDDDFLEVTINTENIKPDDLFPASIFNAPNGLTNEESVEANNEINKNISSLEVNSKFEESPKILNKEVHDSGISDVKQEFQDFSREDLQDVQFALEEETAALIKEKGTQERLATSITDQMQKESQELLMLFGVPYVIAPMEAEAQCAFLDLTNQTQGTVTDDSDIWLFGGKHVYRNFFNQNKYVEYFSEKDIGERLLLTREQMVKLAYLCGCDYTDGIQGVGPVTGLEVLLEFPGDETEGLSNLKEWWTEAHKQVKSNADTKLKTKLKTLSLSEGFPNPAVYEAFMEPAVDESTDKFTWGNPDLDLLREYAYDKLGWTKAKVDEIILPVLKELNKKGTQSNITSFFNVDSVTKSPIKSKRVNRVLTRMKDQKSSGKSGKGKSSRKLPAKSRKGHEQITGTGSGWVQKDQNASDKSLNLSESSDNSESE